MAQGIKEQITSVTSWNLLKWRIQKIYSKDNERKYLPQKMLHPWTTADQPNIFPACKTYHSYPTIQFLLLKKNLIKLIFPVQCWGGGNKIQQPWNRNTDKSASISYKQMLFLQKWRPGFNPSCWSIFMILWSGAAFVATLVWELFPWQLHSFNIILVLRT